MQIRTRTIKIIFRYNRFVKNCNRQVKSFLLVDGSFQVRFINVFGCNSSSDYSDAR